MSKKQKSGKQKNHKQAKAVRKKSHFGIVVLIVILVFAASASFLYYFYPSCFNNSISTISYYIDTYGLKIESIFGSSKTDIQNTVSETYEVDLSKMTPVQLKNYGPECRNIGLTGEFDDDLTVGIAWRSDMACAADVKLALDQLGLKSVYLKEVKYNDWKYSSHRIPSSYQSKKAYLIQEYADLIKDDGYLNSNVAEVMEGIDVVIFTGGEDISPTLYAEPDMTDADSSLNFYNASRDVSDYMLMDYCLDNDIPLLGICRGMQMLGVVSGSSMIKDIPTYSKTHGNSVKTVHRPAKQKGSALMYSPHSVYPRERDSIFNSIIDRDILEKVPSKHHQAVIDLSNTMLSATGYSGPNRTELIEVIERRDKKFAVGVLFHPEIAVVKHTYNHYNKSQFMSKEDGLMFFKALCNSDNF